jgi:lipopolysaccharide export system permease protein
MKILNLYIGRNLLLTTLLGIGILTFVLVSANLLQAFELVARGVSPAILGQFIAYMLPFALQFSIPLAVLCAAVLVFSRMSADHEVTAMRASGISLWQIISPALILAVGLSAFCFYLQVYLAPECRYRANMLRRADNITNPLAMIEPGRYVAFPGHVLYAGRREKNRLEDVQLYVLGSNGQVNQDISAAGGTLVISEDSRTLRLSLEKVIMGQIERGGAAPDTVRHTMADQVTRDIPLGSQQERKPLERRAKHMTMQQILGTIYIYNKRGEPTGPLYLELHKRMSIAFAPIGFLLIGIPFGIRTRRSETSVGLVISLILAALFYVFLSLADSLQDRPQLHPELLVWLPNIIYQIGGLLVIHRITAR